MFWDLFSKKKKKKFASEDAEESKSRRHFRLEFPQFQRPKLYCDRRVYSIIELSESGAKITCDGALPSADIPIDGTICFQDGSKEKIVGKIIRRQGNVLIISLSVGVSLQKMTAEHRRIFLNPAS